MHDRGVTFSAGASNSFYSERIDCPNLLAGESFWREQGSRKIADNKDNRNLLKNSPEESKNAERQKVGGKQSRREREG